MTESALIREIQVAASKHGARLFRQNVGRGWAGEFTKHDDWFGFQVVMRNPRPLHAGLCKGSSDLIGWDARGRFVAIEVKYGKTRVTKEQQAFIDAVNKAGGRAGIARSVEDALGILKG